MLGHSFFFTKTASLFFVKLISKIDPLKYLLSKTTLTGRLTKWIMILSEFDIEYTDRKSIKVQAIVDQLADAPIEKVRARLPDDV